MSLSSTPPSCPLCNRKYLLLYPVRYAVACPKGAAMAPALDGQHFKMDSRAPQSVANAKYTLRALRGGYLYAYDEKNNVLRAYMVLPNGLMWNFPPEIVPPTPDAVASMPPCFDGQQIAAGRCIDADPDKVGNLWVGWSNVLWTKTLLKQVTQADWRKKHMQCIDVPGLLCNAVVPHTGEFKAHHNKIAHFAMDEKAMKAAFAFSNTSPGHEISQHRSADIISQAMSHSPYGQGFIVAVNDPVGVTNDMSELCILSADAGFKEDMQRGKIIYDLLKRTEAGVRQDARDSVAFNDEVAKNSEGDPDGDAWNSIQAIKAMWKAGGISNYNKQQRDDATKYGTDQKGRQDAAADHAWTNVIQDSDGKPTWDKGRVDGFMDKYNTEVAAYKPTLDQLIAAHAAWLSSQLLADWLSGVHDDTDICSGFAYSESVAQSIGKAAGTPACVKHLNSWLDAGDATDTRALYLRALLFNQDDMAKAAGRQVKPSDTQYEQFINLYKHALARADKKKAALLIDRLAVTTTNVLVDALTATGRSTARFFAAVRLSMMSGHALKAGGVSSNDLARWVIDQAQAQGVKLESDRAQSLKAARQASKTATQATQKDTTIYAYEIDVAKLREDGLIEAGSIKTVRIPGVDMTRKWLGSSTPQVFHTGVVTAIIQLAAFKFTVTDFKNSDQFNVVETSTKMVAALMSLGGTVVETLSETVNKGPTHPLSAFILKQWAGAEEVAEGAAKFGRIFGAAGGAVAAVYDLAFNMPEAFRNHQTLLGNLYLASGGLGLYVAIAAAFFPAAVLFWPAIIASFVIALAIAVVSSNALQNWVSRCYFGTGEHYDDVNEELKAYNHAVGA
jgi:hypothetical protein